MRRSAERILTTHAGSLPRPPELVRLFVPRAAGEAVDAAALAAAGRAALAWVVPQQIAAGIDVGNNGEQQREGFFSPPAAPDERLRRGLAAPPAGRRPALPEIHGLDAGAATRAHGGEQFSAADGGRRGALSRSGPNARTFARRSIRQTAAFSKPS